MKYLNDLKWDISEFDESNIKSYNEESNEWYFFEVDIQYLEYLRYHHNDLPFLPQRNIKKLVAKIHDKTECVIYVRKLKQASNHGLVKVHIVIKFNKRSWLKPYIDMNSDLRKAAKNDFEKDFFELMNNEVLGKTMENVKKIGILNL